MCGIVGGVANRDVTPILIEGLKSLEYRGYDSAGLAIGQSSGLIERRRALGKIKALEAVIEDSPISGSIGIAHTRWATHGEPSVANAHPHMAGDFAVVHNGIIENFATLKATLIKEGAQFTSETDTEVIVHCLNREMQKINDVELAIKAVIKQLTGAYALGIIHAQSLNELYVAREGSPLCIGLGVKENFIGSDAQALLPVTSRFIFLEDGDFAKITQDNIHIENADGQSVKRRISNSELSADAVSKGEFSHYMEKEIYEQATAIEDTLRGKLNNNQFNIEQLSDSAREQLKDIQAVHIIACGTSYHAASVARYWLEQYANLPCHVEVASEYRYRHFVVPERTLFIAISQSGETADTLAALKHAKTKGYQTYLGICNAPESSLTRESDLVFLTAAGPEKSVASTKAFTTQLTALLLITQGLGALNQAKHNVDLSALSKIQPIINATLGTAPAIRRMAEHLYEKKNAVFLGRGSLFPVALEGSLKLKEITYIHAEGYPAGELKHGPLALVDENMPIIAVAPNNELVKKLKSNLQEVKARGGRLFVFADEVVDIAEDENTHVVRIPHCDDTIAPIIYTLPLQLLSYYVALLLGTDVDQPRNLAKSVTVE